LRNSNAFAGVVVKMDLIVLPHFATGVQELEGDMGAWPDASVLQKKN